MKFEEKYGVVPPNLHIRRLSDNKEFPSICINPEFFIDKNSIFAMDIESEMIKMIDEEIAARDKK